MKTLSRSKMQCCDSGFRSGRFKFNGSPGSGSVNSAVQMQITGSSLLSGQKISVADPYPHVFGPPGSGSGSISQRY
jgi:hypothetical protein